LCLLAGPVLAQPRIDFRNAVDIGTFNGFYRGTQLQGHLLRDRLGLVRVPAGLEKTSFAYRARPFPEEVLFADRLSFVRFVGGWKPAWNAGEAKDKAGDLAYVDATGKVQYRWELIAPRIDPYLHSGYRDLIISLDNVPWDLGADPKDGAYGQVSPPRDLKEWEQFIEQFARQLVRLYGQNLVDTWSFRMGTEPNGAAGHTFSGGQDGYVRMYDATARALRRVLPHAPFGPGEFSGAMAPDGPEPPLVNHVKLAEHCRQTGVPFDFLANSSHSVPAWRDGKLGGAADPRERVEMNLSSYRNVLSHLPAFSGPIYVFQFGALRSEFHEGERYIDTNEPGGRGAAFAFHVLMEMKAREKRLAGIWHWDVGERFDPRNPDSFLLFGNGWLYSVLDYCIGGKALVADGAPSPRGTIYEALLANQPRVAYLVVSAFNLDRNAKPEKVEVFVPGKRPSHLQWVTLTESNCPYATMRRDLAGQQLLLPDYEKFPVLATVRQMSGRRGVEYVAKNFARYEELQTKSLTLAPFDGDCMPSDGGCQLAFTMEPNSVAAIVLQ
jgi:hypothetical protein